ncbi:MAG: asparagine synthase-related protein [Planctomycetota bacterium]
MCGLAGILRVHEPNDDDGPPPSHLESIPEAWLDILDGSIKHRGPDGAGRFRDRISTDDGRTIDVALVHRRLAILDPEGGLQPMVHDGERLRPDLTYQPGETPIVASERVDAGTPLVALVFNGCVYNQHEVRGQLQLTGVVFESDHADTETFLHGWRHWGRDMRERLDAMYASLIWDRSASRLFGLHDLATQKPIAVSRFADGAAIAYCSCEPGPQRLQASTTDHVATIYDKELLRWTALGWGERPPLIQRSGAFGLALLVRHVEFVRDAIRLDPRENTTRFSAEEAEGLLRQSVHSHLESDVPLAVFLSGGIDSGLVAAFARERRPDLQTLTVRMPDARYDESEAAANTASHLGTQHHTLDCQADPAADVVQLIEQLGLPFGDSSLLPTFWLCRATKQIAGVALSGDGGDELFAGYERYRAWFMMERHSFELALAWPLVDASRLLPRRDPRSLSTKLARFGDAARASAYEDLLKIFSHRQIKRLAPSLPKQKAYLMLQDPMREDFNDYLPFDLMRKTDTASMAVALEVRAPFLSRKLVHRCLSAPVAQLMPRGQRKGLLKLVARRHLPKEIVDRPKMGFAIPVGEWFRTDFGGMRTLLLDHLNSAEPFPGLAEAGVAIDMGYVQRLLREHDDAGQASLWPWKGRDHSQRLYMLLVLSIWSRWLQRAQNDPL